jgi:hypothetical protein
VPDYKSDLTDIGVDIIDTTSSESVDTALIVTKIEKVLESVPDVEVLKKLKKTKQELIDKARGNEKEANTILSLVLVL